MPPPPLLDLSPLLPEKLRVIFPARRCAGLPHEAFPTTYERTVALKDITFTDSRVTPKPKGVAGTIRPVHDTAVALYSNATGDPTNRTALDALADQIARDYYNWKAFDVDVVYNGVIAPGLVAGLTGFHDVIEWRYDATDQWTRVTTQAWGGEPEELHHLDPAQGDCASGDDRNGIGIVVDIPGGTGHNSMRGVLAVEEGRLTLAYDTTADVPCDADCTPPTPCSTICFTILGCFNTPIANAVVTLTKGGVLVGDCTTVNGIATLTLNSGGSGYTSAPAVSFSGVGAGGGVAFATLGTATVASVALTLGGAGYTTAPTVSFTGGGGGFTTATARLAASPVNAIAVTNGGAGYTVPPAVVFAGGGGGAGATATAVLTAGVVTAINITAGGAGYTTAPTISFTGGGGGTGATATAALAAQPVAAITLTVGGSGYTSAPTVVFSGGGGGGGAGALATLGTRAVASVTLVNSGSYTSAPTVVFSGGGGSGARATATLGVRCCIGFFETGTHTVHITAAGYNPVTSDTTFICGTYYTPTIQLFPAPGLSCLKDPCCPDSDQPGPPYAPVTTYPATLTVNDGFGDVTVTLDGAFAPHAWTGYATRTAAVADVNCALHTPGTGVSVPVKFTVSCQVSTNFGWLVRVAMPYCDASADRPRPGAADDSTWFPFIAVAEVGFAKPATCAHPSGSGTFVPSAFFQSGRIFGQVYGFGVNHVTVTG